MIFGENSLEWIYALYATFTNNAIAIPIDIQSTAHEINYILNDCKPDIVFTSDAKRSFIESVLAGSDITTTLLSPSDIDCRNMNNAPVVDFIPNDIHRTACIIYTSGTTGSSKGVMLSYENILSI